MNIRTRLIASSHTLEICISARIMAALSHTLDAHQKLRTYVSAPNIRTVAGSAGSNKSERKNILRLGACARAHACARDVQPPSGARNTRLTRIVWRILLLRTHSCFTAPQPSKSLPFISVSNALCNCRNLCHFAHARTSLPLSLLEALQPLKNQGCPSELCQFFFCWNDALRLAQIYEIR